MAAGDVKARIFYVRSANGIKFDVVARENCTISPSPTVIDTSTGNNAVGQLCWVDIAVTVTNPDATWGLQFNTRAGAVAPTAGKGLVFCGIGYGIIFAGTVVTWMALNDIVSACLGLSALALLLWIPAWHGWPKKPDVAAPPSGPGPRWTLPLIGLAAAYAGDAMGFIPHTVFWVDYIARGLGHGVAVGGYFWVLFGVGAALGVLLLGRLADKIGFGAALTLMLLAKALAVALPLFSSALPALVISSLIVGAATPGAAMLTSGVALELVGVEAHRAAWRKLTLIFSAFQALAALKLGSAAVAQPPAPAPAPDGQRDMAAVVGT
jgi:predicted MFS family arabinose efflux permease